MSSSDRHARDWVAIAAHLSALEIHQAKKVHYPLLGWLAQILNTVAPSALGDFIVTEEKNLIAVQMKAPRDLSVLKAEVLFVSARTGSLKLEKQPIRSRIVH